MDATTNDKTYDKKTINRQKKRQDKENKCSPVRVNLALLPGSDILVSFSLMTNQHGM